MLIRSKPWVRANFASKFRSLAHGAGLLAALGMGVIFFSGPLPGHAQTREPPAPEAPAAEAEEQRRLIIRFVTEGDYPPFNYYDDEGVLTGFNVDLARAICLEVGAACDVKVQSWDELVPALKRGEADAVIASHMVTSAMMEEVEFTDRYFHTPGRFAGRFDSPKTDMSPDALDGVRIGVAKGTTHEAYLKAFFRDSRIVGLRECGYGPRSAAAEQGRLHFRRRHRTGVLARRNAIAALLRVQRRGLLRAQVFRRRARHRRCRAAIRR